jgi:hypothetical protein
MAIRDPWEKLAEGVIRGRAGELRLIEKLIRLGRGGYVHFESEEVSITRSREST